MNVVVTRAQKVFIDNEEEEFEFEFEIDEEEEKVLK